jgi:hypothetical protein
MGGLVTLLFPFKQLLRHRIDISRVFPVSAHETK